MRSIPGLILIALLAGCASSEPAPAPKAAAPAASAAPAAAAKPPQCYSGDSGKFHSVGEKSSVAGVDVICTASADGKAAFWGSAKK